jgi:hypothetical protein
MQRDAKCLRLGGFYVIWLKTSCHGLMVGYLLNR